MMRTLIATGAAAMLCSGCFLAPGVKMDQHALQDRGKGTSDPARFRIVPITPQVLTAQARSRADAEKALHGQAEGPALAPGDEDKIARPSPRPLWQFRYSRPVRPAARRFRALACSHRARYRRLCARLLES